MDFPDFPEAHTHGKDLDEALDEAADCLGSAVAFRMADKEEIPRPSRIKRGQRPVAVPFWIAGKLALYLAMRERGVNNSELARRIGVRETVVRRMLDSDHATKPVRLQRALAALGKHLVIAVQDAA
ncbi:MAG TPA: type II toxin-antitoxin system HicB family antitoxin [Bryobacterales bacterium]|nr:type II toxin-antitoxin system HicB family antitoxin [Bryobacterales bacterium]